MKNFKYFTNMNQMKTESTAKRVISVKILMNSREVLLFNG